MGPVNVRRVNVKNHEEKNEKIYDGGVQYKKNVYIVIG